MFEKKHEGQHGQSYKRDAREIRDQKSYHGLEHKRLTYGPWQVVSL